MAAEPLDYFQRGSLILGSILSSNERLLLIVISSHGGSNGKAYPARETIALQCGFSLKTVDRTVKALIGEPYRILRRYRRRQDGRQTSSRYFVEWARLREFQRPPDEAKIVEEDVDPSQLALFEAEENAEESAEEQGVILTLRKDRLTPSGASDCPPRGRQIDAQTIPRNYSQETHSPPSERQSDALPTAGPSLVVCADLINDFYRQWFGPTFTPPNATPAEMGLAAEILAACSPLDFAKVLQTRVVDRLRRSFPTCRRFLGSNIEWRRLIAANAKTQSQATARENERQRREAEIVNAEQQTANDEYDAALPRWNALTPEERRQFLSAYPAAVAGREFFAVLDFASTLEAAPCP